MSTINFIEKIVGRIINSQCKHPHINQYESGEFCPDCGKKIQLSWIVLKCQHCKTLRMPKVNEMGNISPLQKYCSKCGSDKWFSKLSNNIDISESLYAIAIKEEIKETTPLIPKKANSTEVWVESPEKTTPKPGRNVIKARRRG